MFECPINFQESPTITMAHGGGGSQMRKLLQDLIQPLFGKTVSPHDSALVDFQSSRLALTTDSYVIKPLFFPGGDIGRLAVYGSVNDLAMSGATPKYLSLALILEEGFSTETLWRVLCSVATAAQECEIQIITGDTKVVERGHGDGLFINTSAVGELVHGRELAPKNIQEGDSILISGDIGRHGVAVLAERHQFKFSEPFVSDLAPVHRPLLAALAQGLTVHCARDCTRGGLAASLNELAENAGLSFEIDENLVPVSPLVHGACELFGLEVLAVANEGCFVCFVPPEQETQTLELLQKFPVSAQARVIGQVHKKSNVPVVLKTRSGQRRRLPLPQGELLPRIC